MTKIYGLAFEVNGDTINLEQDMGCGDVARIDLHPIHVRLLAEQVGILAPSSNVEADRTIARLNRQLRTLAAHIDRLDTLLLNIAVKGHECVDEECAYSAASLELAEEFVADLPPVTRDASRHVTHASPVTSPPGADKTNAARQKRHRERQKQRNGASVTPVTDSARNAAPALFETAGA